MTNREFKAWFEGFTEAMSGTPTKAQWARIKARVAEIDGEPIRLLSLPYYPTWSYTTTSGGSTGGFTTSNTTYLYAQGQLEASEIQAAVSGAVS